MTINFDIKYIEKIRDFPERIYEIYVNEYSYSDEVIYLLKKKNIIAEIRYKRTGYVFGIHLDKNNEVLLKLMYGHMPLWI